MARRCRQRAALPRAAGPAEPPLPAWECGALPRAVPLFCHGETGASISQGCSRGTPAPHSSHRAGEKRRCAPKSHLCARWLPWLDALGDPQPRRKDLGVLQPFQELRNKRNALPAVPTQRRRQQRPSSCWIAKELRSLLLPRFPTQKWDR